MKYLLVIIGLFTACVINHKNAFTILRDAKSDTSELYRVYKIDSIKSYYLIYAKRKMRYYKIVSRKEIVDGQERISLFKRYDFNLQSAIPNIKTNNGTIFVTNPYISCYYFSDSTKICLEKDSILDLYKADNIRGLYYIKQK